MSIGLALLVSTDPLTIGKVSIALEEFSLSPDVCRGMQESIRLLNRRKFEAVIVDLQLGEECGLILDEVHVSPSNVTAVRFDGETCTSSKINPHSSPSCRSTITASNFRRFNKRIDSCIPRQTSGESENSSNAMLTFPIVRGSVDTKSASPIDIVKYTPYKVVLCHDCFPLACARACGSGLSSSSLAATLSTARGLLK